MELSLGVPGILGICLEMGSIGFVTNVLTWKKVLSMDALVTVAIGEKFSGLA